jgi:hypothetical protein
MKILIYTTHSHHCGNVSLMSAPNHHAYAFRNGYDLMREFCSYEELQERMPKIEALLDWYDAIFMLDADTLITNFDGRLEHICQMGPDVIICQELLGPHTDINFGVVMLNSTEKTKEFCREIHREKPNWETLPHVWQSYINANLTRLPITVMPARTFNSVIHPINSYWEKGDFIAHFCGHGGGEPGTNPLMEQFIQEHGYYF